MSEFLVVRTQDLSSVTIMHVFKPVRKADFSGNEFTGSLVSLRMHA